MRAYSPCIGSCVGYARRWRRPRSLYTCSSLGCARRWRRPRRACALRTRLCSQMEAPPQSLHLLLSLLCGHLLCCCVTLALFSLPCLRHFPSPPLSACRSPLAPALSALAPLLAMPTLALSPASVSTPSPQLSPRGLTLLHVTCILLLHVIPGITCVCRIQY